ncbi:hypothetical protein ILYODFUR_033318 [Ilyodon furcidens]|uniref:Uncharacterized protein n=1 Tax=Ilyodon furcidens TaxID=33524 RepID=A0ABV0UL38_9TELE
MWSCSMNVCTGGAECCQGPWQPRDAVSLSFFSSPVFPTPLSLSVFFPTLFSFHQVLPTNTPQPPSAGAGDHRQRISDGRATSAPLTSSSLTEGRRETGKRGGEKRASEISGRIKLVGETTSVGELGVRAAWVAAGRSGASFSPSSPCL